MKLPDAENVKHNKEKLIWPGVPKIDDVLHVPCGCRYILTYIHNWKH